jgi:integrase
MKVSDVDEQLDAADSPHHSQSRRFGNEPPAHLPQHLALTRPRAPRHISFVENRLTTCALGKPHGLRRRRGSLQYKRTGSLAEVAELLGDSKRVAADHYVYALTDYREVDRTMALARLFAGTRAAAIAKPYDPVLDGEASSEVAEVPLWGAGAGCRLHRS